MICNKCKDKPLARGVKQVKCFKCGKDTLTNSFYSDICDNCSDENLICQYCGEYIIQEKVDIVFICSKCNHHLFVNKHKVTFDFLANIEDLDCPDCGKGGYKNWIVLRSGSYDKESDDFNKI